MSWRCSKNDDFTTLAAESSIKERMNRIYKVRISKGILSRSADLTGTHTDLVWRGHRRNWSFLLCVSWIAIYEASKVNVTEIWMARWRKRALFSHENPSKTALFSQPPPNADIERKSFNVAMMSSLCEPVKYEFK